MSKKAGTFEENLKELEDIIAGLESGDAPLDKCISMFEDGVKLSNKCLAMIEEARQKITLLTEKGEADYTPANTTDE